MDRIDPKLFAAIRLAGQPGGPVLMLPTADLQSTIQTIGRDGLRMVALGKTPSRGTIRVRFEHKGAYPGTCLLLVKVVGTREHDSGATELWLKHKAGWSGSRDTLVEFLTMTLQHDDLPESGLSRQARGWGYVFPKYTAKPTDTGPVLTPPCHTKPEPEPTYQRKEQRVTVRVPVRYSVGGTGALKDGHVYNVSPNGLFVLTDYATPKKNSTVQVHFPALTKRDGGAALLEGLVVWIADSMGDRNGFGVQLARIDDGKGGAAWTKWIRNQQKLSGEEIDWS